jgi:hypothetical protein
MRQGPELAPTYCWPGPGRSSQRPGDLRSTVALMGRARPPGPLDQMSRLLIATCRWVGQVMRILRHLAVALPVGVLVGDARAVHGRLDVSGPVDRPRGSRVLARRRSRPVERPHLPGEFGIFAAVDGGRQPRSGVDSCLDAGDRGAPGGNDPVAAIFLGDLGGRGLEEAAPDVTFRPDLLTVALLAADVILGYFIRTQIRPTPARWRLLRCKEC